MKKIIMVILLLVSLATATVKAQMAPGNPFPQYGDAATAFIEYKVYYVLCPVCAVFDYKSVSRKYVSLWKKSRFFRKETFDGPITFPDKISLVRRSTVGVIERDGVIIFGDEREAVLDAICGEEMVREEA